MSDAEETRGVVQESERLGALLLRTAAELDAFAARLRAMTEILQQENEPWRN